MRIGKENGKIINTKEVYLHDSIVETIVFDRLNKMLKVKVELSDINELAFYDVAGFEMTACDYWGKSPHVCDFEWVKDKKLLPKLLENEYADKSMGKDMIEVLFTFISGDTLRIVCKYIDIN